MKYAMCPKCGRRLCKGENGTKVEMECPKCGEFASVIIEEDDIHISMAGVRMPPFAVVAAILRASISATPASWPLPGLEPSRLGKLRVV